MTTWEPYGSHRLRAWRGQGVTPRQRGPAQGHRLIRLGQVRPLREMTMAFIHTHRKHLGIGPICRELAIAPSLCHEHAALKGSPCQTGCPCAA